MSTNESAVKLRKLQVHFVVVHACFFKKRLPFDSKWLLVQAFIDQNNRINKYIGCWYQNSKDFMKLFSTSNMNVHCGPNDSEILGL